MTNYGNFGMIDMANVLRDEDSGICTTDEYASTGSQISVILTGSQNDPPIHWLTATPNPKISIFKPFIFCPDVDIGESTLSPKYGDSDPLQMKPRFSTEVDRRHTLYKEHEDRRRNSDGKTLIENGRKLENKIIEDIKALKAGVKDLSKYSDIFKKMCGLELEIYKNE